MGENAYWKSLCDVGMGCNNTDRKAPTLEVREGLIFTGNGEI